VANPQVENGHTRIANPILEALSRAPLNGAAFRIALWVMRETYGWQRKVAEITLRKISKMTVLNYRTVQREVKELLQCRVLRRECDGEGKSWFGVVKDYETWRLPGISTCGQQTVCGQQALCGQSTLKDTANRPHLNTEGRKKKESVPGKERQTDPRFQPIKDHYLRRTEELTGTKPFDATDGKNLQGLLARNLQTALAEVLRWLDHAFDSTKTYPLQPGFRMSEFCRHCSKYTRGPLLADQKRGQGGMTQEELHAAAKLETQKAQEAYATP